MIEIFSALVDATMDLIGNRIKAQIEAFGERSAAKISHDNNDDGGISTSATAHLLKLFKIMKKRH